MAEIITNLHPDGDENTNLYPNIKKENIPSKSISTDKLDDNVLSLIGSLKPSGTDTSTNILAFTSNKGIYVATDNGHWYYWNGSVYADGGVYQGTEIGNNSIENKMIKDNEINTGKLSPYFESNNLFDVGAVKKGKSLNANGIEQNDANGFYSTTKVPVIPNEKLYLFLSRKSIAGAEQSFDAIFSYFAQDDTFISSNRADAPNTEAKRYSRTYPYGNNEVFKFVKIFTVPANASYMLIQGKMSYVDKINEVMVCRESEYDGIFSAKYNMFGVMSEKAIEDMKILYNNNLISYGDEKGCSPHFDNDAIGIIETALNSVRTNKNASNNQVKLNTHRFSHNSALVIDGSKAYCVYIENEVDYEDNPSSANCYTTLTIVDNVNDLVNSNKTNYLVGKHGDSVGNDSIILGVGEPNIIKINNNLIISFSAKLSDNKWYMLYRVFDTSNNTFGVIEKMKIKVNNEYVDFTNDNVSSLLNIDNFDKWLSMHSQWAFDGTNYYAGLCAESFITKSCIIKSSNCIEWELFVIPNHSSINAQYENALIYKDGYIWGAIRNTDISLTIYKLKISDLSFIQYFNFKCANSKPCWYIKSNILYLAYTTFTNEQRTYLNIANLQNLPSSVRVINQLTIWRNWYPSIAQTGDKIFVSSTTDGNAIYLRELAHPVLTKQSTTRLLERILKLIESR